ncbi:hypothetical protein HPB51_019370 [Rhipicephalus microplus]|uniref:Uncharacterized protein n=1 Tax=Rhipicephalus microplus TaxID=6941 RepID=A0A9J6DB52_RHIMP|nr:hypothetical protein HPB51_019370 [Rhipicephalus microplus]
MPGCLAEGQKSDPGRGGRIKMEDAVAACFPPVCAILSRLSPALRGLAKPITFVNGDVNTDEPRAREAECKHRQWKTSDTNELRVKNTDRTREYKQFFEGRRCPHVIMDPERGSISHADEDASHDHDGAPREDSHAHQNGQPNRVPEEVLNEGTELSEKEPLFAHKESITGEDVFDFSKGTRETQSPGNGETHLTFEKEPEVIKTLATQKSSDKAMFYGVDDRPAWYFSAVLGLQHYLIVTSGALSYPFALAPALCMREEDPARGYLISTIFFISGIGTIIQTTLGIRLPIIQGCSVTFLVPILATMALPEWRCPTEEELIAARDPDSGITGPATDQEWTAVWQIRMSEVNTRRPHQKSPDEGH